MPPVHQRSLSLDNTISIIFGIFTVLLGTLSIIVAVAIWRSGHPTSSRQGKESHIPPCKPGLLTAGDDWQSTNNTMDRVELVSVQLTSTTMSTSSGNNGYASEAGVTGPVTEHVEG